MTQLALLLLIILGAGDAFAQTKSDKQSPSLTLPSVNWPEDWLVSNGQFRKGKLLTGASYGWRSDNSGGSIYYLANGEVRHVQLRLEKYRHQGRFVLRWTEGKDSGLLVQEELSNGAVLLIYLDRDENSDLVPTKNGFYGFISKFGNY